MSLDLNRWDFLIVNSYCFHISHSSYTRDRYIFIVQKYISSYLRRIRMVLPRVRLLGVRGMMMVRGVLLRMVLGRRRRERVAAVSDGGRSVAPRGRRRTGPTRMCREINSTASGYAKSAEHPGGIVRKQLNGRASGLLVPDNGSGGRKGIAGTGRVRGGYRIRRVFVTESVAQGIRFYDHGGRA